MKLAIAAVVIAGAIVAAWLSRHHGVATAANATAGHTAPRPPNSAPLTPHGEGGDDVSFVAGADRVGSLLLEGEVIDEHEHPVASAEVTINANPTRTPDGTQDPGGTGSGAGSGSKESGA